MRRKRKRPVPTMIIWDRRQQQRFIEAVERFVGLVGDLELLVAAKKRRSMAAFKANQTRQGLGGDKLPEDARELVGSSAARGGE